MKVSSECEEYADRAHAAEQDWNALVHSVNAYINELTYHGPGATVFRKDVAKRLEAILRESDA